jgi:hypothetical protein
MDLNFRGCEGVDLIHLAGNTVKWKDLENTVMKTSGSTKSRVTFL